MAVSGERLRPISRVDAPPPGAPGGWYDEMLVLGDTVVVIGYSYAERATEVGLFDIDGAGILSRRGTFYLRSDDYYSARNYTGLGLAGRSSAPC